MRIKALILSVILIISSCFILSSCSQTIVEKYKNQKLKLSEAEQVEYTKKAIQDFTVAYAFAKDLSSYTLKTDLGFLLPDSEIKVAFKGDIKKNNGTYTSDNVSASMAGIKILTGTCNSGDENKLSFSFKTTGESFDFELPFNYAKIGGVVYPTLTETMLSKGTLIQQKPDVIKFELSASDAEELYGETFEELNKILSDAELPFDNVFDVTFKGCTIFATVKNGVVISVESSINVNTGSDDVTFEFIGELN